MADVSWDVFGKRQSKNLDPLLDFKWACVSLPLGHDVSYVEEVDLPWPEISPKDGLFGAGTYTYYPSFEDINAFDITFYEDSKLNTTKWLMEWFERIREPKTGAYYLPRNYKFDIVVELMDTTGKTIGVATLQNVWPTSKGNWPLTYTGGERIRVQQNFSIDSLKFDPKV